MRKPSNAILPDAYESAVDEQKLEVVGYPQVEIENVGKEGATFKMPPWPCIPRWSWASTRVLRP